MWAMPWNDEAVTALYNQELPRMNQPLKLADIDPSLDKYAAIFIPGGHGAMNDEVSLAPEQRQRLLFT